MGWSSVNGVVHVLWKVRLWYFLLLLTRIGAMRYSIVPFLMNVYPYYSLCRKKWYSEFDARMSRLSLYFCCWHIVFVWLAPQTLAQIIQHMGWMCFSQKKKKIINFTCFCQKIHLFANHMTHGPTAVCCISKYFQLYSW